MQVGDYRRDVRTVEQFAADIAKGTRAERSTVRRIATVERLLEPRTRKAWKKATARPNVGDQVRMARTTNVLTVTAYNTATNVLTMKDGPGNLYYYTAASWGDTTLEVLE